MKLLVPRYRPPTRAVVDALISTALCVVAVVGFTPAFGDWHYLGAALGGLVVGSAAAVVGALYRLPSIPTVVVAVAAYFLFGSVFAMSDVALLGFLPTAETLSGLTRGAVFGWADIVTLLTPVGAPPYITVVPYVGAWLVAFVGVTLALRWLPSRPRATALSGSVLLIGPLVLLLAGILVGTHDPFHAALRGVAFAVIAVVWLGLRSRPSAERGSGGRLVLRRKIMGTVALIALAVGGGTVVGAALPLADEGRFVVRDHVEPPFDPLEFASPLAAFRLYSKLVADDTVFTVSGLQPGQVVRLAALDSYDGSLWSVSGAQEARDGSGSYALVGQEIAAPDFEVGSTTEVEITIGSYDDVWLPTVGYATTVVFGGADARSLATGLRYNSGSGTGIVTAGLKSGDTYRLTGVEPAVPADLSDIPTAGVELPPATSVQVVGAKANDFAGGATTPFDKLDAISDALSTQGYLRHGLVTEDPPASRSGHGADRLIQLFSSTYMVGDAEQFASAFALMARSLGYPSRVVMGFAPPEGSSGVVEVKGEDVTAWVEVAFEGIGWVPFFPTPDQTEVPQDQLTEPKTKPQPQVRQPPRSIENPDELLSPLEIDDGEKPDDEKFTIPAWVWLVSAAVGIPLVLIVVPLVVVALVKSRRRRRRRSQGTPVDRIAGGWDELVDAYAELGYPVAPGRTRTELAEEVAGSAAAETGTVLTLARQADRAVFSDRDRSVEEVDNYWADALAEIERMTRPAGRWRRLVNRVYVRPGSLRRRPGTRSS